MQIVQAAARHLQLWDVDWVQRFDPLEKIGLSPVQHLFTHSQASGHVIGQKPHRDVGLAEICIVRNVFLCFITQRHVGAATIGVFEVVEGVSTGKKAEVTPLHG